MPVSFDMKYTQLIVAEKSCFKVGFLKFLLGCRKTVRCCKLKKGLHDTFFCIYLDAS